MAVPMSRRLLPLLVVVLPLLAPVLAAAQSPSPATDAGAVLVVKVDGSIDRTVDGYLRDAIAEAERDGAVVVLQLDSAGTLDGDPVALAERVHDASVPVVVWTGPAPAKASGAGLLLMYAASEAAVAPGIGIGPTVPLDLAGGPDATVDEVRTLAERWASESGREIPTLFPSEPVPAADAIDGRVANIIAGSITELLTQLDGHTVTVGGD